MQGVDPSNPGEAPALWAIEEVAAPVTERLRAHFASGRPTDRPEKPEWLFGLALRMARQLAPGTAPLQGSLEILGLGNVYHVPLEFSRAIRSAVQVLGVCHLKKSHPFKLMFYALAICIRSRISDYMRCHARVGEHCSKLWTCGSALY